MLIHYPITPKRPPLHPQHPNSSFSACSETFRINNYLSSPIHIHKAPEHLIYLLTLPPPFISRNSSSTFLYEYMTYISPMVSSIPHGPLALTILRRPMRESRWFRAPKLPRCLMDPIPWSPDRIHNFLNMTWLLSSNGRIRGIQAATDSFCFFSRRFFRLYFLWEARNCSRWDKRYSSFRAAISARCESRYFFCFAAYSALCDL